ncbi:uncharacterized protein LOC108666353 [Hyalella azteca]|uniref:Uncharacterized protein LOC108666353 n=1 Tax=Hyalella azteca TaxID=294128 RepID=A0A8B7N4A9_HYAAZ|nr:uncharacterized protein LOC108666353 [Hyalella azteca]
MRLLCNSIETSRRLYSNYKPVENIGRCLHLDDALICCQLKCLVPHHLFNHKRAELSNTTVLWSEPVRDARRHNKFGNVSFTVAWSDMYRQFGPHMYYLRQRTSHNITTEILITKKLFNTLELVDFNAKDAPVRRGICNCASESKICNCGPLEYATEVQRCETSIVHQIQIAVDATLWEGFWVYALSTIVPNVHKKFCFRHRYVTKKPCRFYYNTRQARNFLGLHCNYELDGAFRRERYKKFGHNWMLHFESYSQSPPYYFEQALYGQLSYQLCMRDFWLFFNSTSHEMNCMILSRADLSRLEQMVGRLMWSWWQNYDFYANLQSYITRYS